MSLPAISCFFLVSLLPVLLAAWPAGEGATSQPGKRSAEELIRRLGDRSFKERDKATRQLVEGKNVTTALRQALQSSDLEVIRRIKGILKARAQRGARRQLELLKTAVRDGYLDLAIELLARWSAGFEEAAYWAEVRKLVTTLVKLDGQQNGRIKLNPWPPSMVMDARPGKIRIMTADRVTQLPDEQDGLPWSIRAGEVDLKKIIPRPLAIACSGPVRDFAVRGVVLANGPVELSLLGGAIILCDSDVTLIESAASCLVIARGTITCKGFMNDCHFITGKRVILGTSHLRSCIIKDQATAPFGRLGFLSLREKDILVEPGKGGVRLLDVVAGTPFAKAGLRKGDMITAVDGKAADSEETLRRLLRRSLLSDDGLILRFLRDGKAHEIWLDSPW